MKIEKRGGMLWYYFSLDGVRYRGTTGLEANNANLKAASTIGAQKELEAKAGLAPKPGSSIAFSKASEFFTHWVNTVGYRERQNSGKRILASMKALRAFFGDIVVARIDRMMVEEFISLRLDRHRVTNHTVLHDLSALSTFFKDFAIPRDWANANPVRLVKKPAARNVHDAYVIPAEEEARYFQFAKGPISDLATLMLNQGCRPEELLAMRQEDVDLKAGTLAIRGGKTKSARRTLPLTSASKAVLKRRITGRSQWVFPSPRYPGQHMSKLNNPHDRVCREAGVSWTIYDFRHTFATRLARVETNPYTFCKVMGWSSIKMASKYVHVEAQPVADAMAKFDQARLAPEKLRRVK